MSWLSAVHLVFISGVCIPHTNWIGPAAGVSISVGLPLELELENVYSVYISYIYKKVRGCKLTINAPVL